MEKVTLTECPRDAMQGIHDFIPTQQKIEYINKSDSILNEIYLHNWANAYRDKNTPLAKRFVEKNSKSFHFTSEKNRGNTDINTIFVDYNLADWKITKNKRHWGPKLPGCRVGWRSKQPSRSGIC